MFNAYKYVKKLEEAGVTREQAETHIQIVSEIMESNLATQQDMAMLRQDVKHEITLSEQRMTIRLGTIVSVAIGIAVTLAKLVS
jgi:repressor of nif and glnA expression